MAISYSFAAAASPETGNGREGIPGKTPQLCLQELRGKELVRKDMVGVEGAGRKKLGNDLGFPSLLTLLGSRGD